MLWSEPEEGPHAETRAAQAMLRRLSWVLALAVVAAVLLAAGR
jgi:hypothetical protein